jgi:type II secretory ATPase GspE/PulE/Tfp pilus assembly ATPase PilB-like protein
MAKKAMLVIDDEPVLCKALGALFSQKGFTVTTATTAHEALERAQQAQADVALLDLKLPDASGLDVLSTLKERFPQLRIVVISALSDISTIHEALERGASDYLPKPFDFDRCFYVAMGFETADMTSAVPEPEALARMPADAARRHQALPLRWDGAALHVALADPLDAERVEALRALLKCPVTPVAALGGPVADAIRRSYPNTTTAPARRTRRVAQAAPAATPAPAREAEAAAALLLDLVRHAHANRATDLHLGTGPAGPWVRERIDGVVAEAPAGALQGSYGDLVAYLKRAAGLESAPRTAPQQGRLSLSAPGLALDLRLSMIPAARGEHVAIRLLEPSRALAFEHLGLTEDQRLGLASLLAKPSGLLLVTGPSGCGKSSTLRACLAKLHTGRAHLVTVEDPIEYELAGVTQIPLQPKSGLTFAEALRAAARHDPDVVMVGDLPDQETAGLAVRTALTGRLVLAGLHTTDASSAFTRLFDLGVEPFLLCSTVSGVLAQRLVRKLCASCREPYEVEAASLAHLGISPAKPAGGLQVWRGKGCEKCRGTGYAGRTGVFELLAVDYHVRSLVIKRTSGAQIRQSAISKGMASLSQSVWRKVEGGDTSLEELIRIVSPELR